jgi:hypothetical protein
MRSLLALLVMVANAAQAETLVYQGTNKWVAPADNAPLRALTAQAKAGKTSFTVTLPAENRDLAVTRLEILTDILEKAAPKGAGVVLTESATGSAAANTLEVVAE